MTIKRSIRTPIMHRAVEANGLVFVGGTIADDTTLPMAGQTRQILARIGDFLAQIGVAKNRIVAATIFVTDLSMKKEMDAVWTAWFGEDLPARATVGVADLGGGALIEIVVTAARGGSAGEA